MRQSKQTERGFLMHYARVMLRESMARRGDRNGFDHFLLNAACRATRLAFATPHDVPRLRVVSDAPQHVCAGTMALNLFGGRG